MNKEQFKLVFSLYANSMLLKWFDSKSILDTMCRSLGKTLIDANINKYDTYLDFITDLNGNVLIESFLDNLLQCYIPYLIDLTQYNIPLLPNKILLIGKQDLELFKDMCKLNMNL